MPLRGIADPRQHEATVLAQVAQVRGRRRISHCARPIAEPRPQQRRGVITGKPQSVALVSEARLLRLRHSDAFSTAEQVQKGPRDAFGHRSSQAVGPCQLHLVDYPDAANAARWQIAARDAFSDATGTHSQPRRSLRNSDLHGTTLPLSV